MADSPGQTVAASPLLETKLYIPRWRSGLVPRARLIERLDSGFERKLTIVSAPAGSGKTTVLSEWLAADPVGERQAAWVSLDQSDNDPSLFWGYFIAALQKVRSGVGENALSLLHAPQSAPIEVLIASSYTQRLLSAFDKPTQPVYAASGRPGAPDIAEPLTEREAEILRLISVGMTNQEIADQLFISLSSVKRHIANAYGKLGVGHRTEAIARANELNLL
jgi:ATP/maltotriose-dependent transcriptional regulator MalT